MRNFLAIVKKELHSLFVSPIAYVVLAVFFLVSGYFFFAILNSVHEQVMQMARFGQMGATPIDETGVIQRNFYGVLSTLLLFFVPMLTMGILAEEKRRGTVELLFTAPLTNLQLIFGKFTAVSLFLVLMLAPALIDMSLLDILSEPRPPLAPLLAGFLGAVLLGASLMAVGLFISSLTENQIVAAVLTFSVFLVLWVLDVSAGTGTTLANQVLHYLSVLNHYDDFTKGVLDTEHVVFYLSFVALGLYLTSVSLDSRKWRQ